MSRFDRDRIYETAIKQLASEKAELPKPNPVTCNVRPAEFALLSQIRASAWSY